MWPVVARWGDAALLTYPLLFSAAFFVGMWVWIRETRPLGIAAEKIVNLTLGCLFAGLVGARLLFIATQWRRFASGELGFWSVWEGGLVWYGGFLATLLWLAWALPRNGLSRRLGLDSAAPAAAAAHAVGRLGCFANGCCHGSRCDLPWAVVYRNPLSAARPLDVPLHPTQIYEALGLAILSFALSYRRKKRGSPLGAARIYLAAYGVLRFLLEFTRGDTLRGEFDGLSTSQWISIGLILSALFLDSPLWRSHKRGHES